MTKNMSWTGTHPAVDLWAEARQERDEWQARAEAAERRVAELEAQLAAQAWRPVTEPPTEAGDYLVWVKYDGEPGFCAVCGWDRVLQWDDNFVHPRYWYPLPALSL